MLLAQVFFAQAPKQLSLSSLEYKGKVQNPYMQIYIHIDFSTFTLVSIKGYQTATLKQKRFFICSVT